VQLDYDYIIIGSGFGGSVSALRLAEKGYKVLVIEKGKWYKPDDFPKTNWNLKKWLWIPFLRFFGIMKISFFKHVLIISGTGVGGGSLVYANALPVPKESFYKHGSWKGLADWKEELKTHYDKALQMLGADRNPKLFDGDLALKELAGRLKLEDKFEHTDVAVFFGEPDKEVKDPYFKSEGPDRSGCNFCGGCMTGCRHNAKNTLDKNYLWLARKIGAEILAETEVTDVKPIDGNSGSSGYRVKTKRKTGFPTRREEFTAKGVVFSGGVLGTIKLLLKLKKKSLPGLSEKVGDNILTNNETLISVSTLDKDRDVSKGVAIGSILHTDENSHLEVVRYSEGSGFWKLLHTPYTTGKNSFVRIAGIIGAFLGSPIKYLKIYWFNSWSKSTAVLLFMQSINSTLKFRQNIFGNMVSRSGSGKRPSPDIPESIELTRKYSEVINGKASSFLFESIGNRSSTAHILGGAPMGKDPSEGVIDKDHRVFGYENMYVIDGSAISSNPGVNPSLTITAMAERAMDQIKIKETRRKTQEARRKKQDVRSKT